MYTVAVQNLQSAPANEVVVSVTPPVGVLYDPSASTPGCEQPIGFFQIPAGQPQSIPPPVICPLGSLVGGEGAQVEIVVRVSPHLATGVPLHIYARADSPSPEPNLENNEALLTVWVLKISQLYLPGILR